MEAIVKEIQERAGEYRSQVFDTLYFGGGTPSILNIEELDIILDSVYKNYHFADQVEFTLEANPDDLNTTYLKTLRSRNVNRLSVGIQSFRQEDLVLMRRSHDAHQAGEAITNAQKSGFENISIDLIYGIPGMSSSDFSQNLKRAFTFNIPHISAYHLTFEPGTVFDHWRKKGKLLPVNEEESLLQFSLLREMTRNQNYLHYEISNFARENFFSKHNLSYWKQVQYIGIGPSAHSYNGKQRRWNISNSGKYVEEIRNNTGKYFDYEDLTTNDLFNEYVLTSLRTMWGMDLDEVRARFGVNYVKYISDVVKKFRNGGMIEIRGSKINLSEKGIFASDFVMSEFFKMDDP